MRVTRMRVPQCHVRQRPSGSWAVVVPLSPDPATGRRRSKWLTAPTQEAAERLRRKAIAEIEAGRRMAPGDLPLSDYLRDWLDTWITPRRRARTVEIYRFAIERHILPVLGRIPLSRLTPRHLEDYYLGKLKTLAPGTVRIHHGILGSALRRAVKDEVLERSPVERAEPPAPAPPCGQALQSSQLRALIERLEGHRLKLPVLLASIAGLRRGEVLALRWQDVDLDTGRLEVHQSLSEAGTIGPPKTASSRRAVILPPFVIEALIQARAEQARNRFIAGGLWKGGGYVVCRADGSRVHPRCLNVDWVRFRRGCGLPGIESIRFHDLRHSAGTHAHRSGAPSRAVAARLGHATLATTEIYLHGQDEDDAAIAAWLEARFGGR